MLCIVYTPFVTQYIVKKNKGGFKLFFFFFFVIVNDLHNTLSVQEEF